MTTQKNSQVPATSDPHAPLVAAFQAGRQAAARIADAKGKSTPALLLTAQTGSDAAAQLIDKLLGLAMEKIRQEAVLRREPGWFERNIDDLRGDAIEWLLINLEKYRDGEGSVTAYIATRAAWLASDLLYTYSHDAGKLEYSWYKVRSAAIGCASRLREITGRTPSNEELAAALLDEARNEMAERYTERHPELVEDKVELDRRVHDRLSRDGIFAAVRHLDAILELGANDVRFDAFVGDGETITTIGDTTPSSFDVEAAVLNRSTVDILDNLYAVALGDAQWARASLAGRFGVLDDVDGTAALPGVRRSGEHADRRQLSIPRLAEITGRDKSDMRKVLNAAAPRLAAPHAQYAHLATFQVDLISAEHGLNIYSRTDFANA